MELIECAGMVRFGMKLRDFILVRARILKRVAAYVVWGFYHLGFQ